MQNLSKRSWLSEALTPGNKSVEKRQNNEACHWFLHQLMRHFIKVDKIDGNPGPVAVIVNKSRSVCKS